MDAVFLCCFIKSKSGGWGSGFVNITLKHSLNGKQVPSVFISVSIWSVWNKARTQSLVKQRPGLRGGRGVGRVGCVSSVKFEWEEVGWKTFIFEK